MARECLRYDVPCWIGRGCWHLFFFLDQLESLNHWDTTRVLSGGVLNAGYDDRPPCVASAAASTVLTDGTTTKQAYSIVSSFSFPFLISERDRKINAKHTDTYARPKFARVRFVVVVQQTKDDHSASTRRWGHSCKRKRESGERHEATSDANQDRPASVGRRTVTAAISSGCSRGLWMSAARGGRRESDRQQSTVSDDGDDDDVDVDP